MGRFMIGIFSTSFVLYFCTALSSFVVDRVTKIWALHSLAAGDVSVLPGFNLHLVFNTGISFSLFANHPLVTSTALIAIVAAVTLGLVVIWYHYALPTRLSQVGYGMILGGAVGNLYDRLTHGAVIDFIDWYCGVWHWPTFNGADTFIVLGFIVLIWEMV